MCADIFWGVRGKCCCLRLHSIFCCLRLHYIFYFLSFPDLCFFMSVGLVAIAAGLRNLLGFSFHVLGSEFSIYMSTLNLLFVYHLLVGFFQQ